MGAMSQIDAARQEAGFSVGQVTDWFNRNRNLDREILLMVATDPQLLRYAINSQRMPSPKPATDHVALQQRRPRKPKWDLSMTHDEAKIILGTFTAVTLTTLVLAISLAVA